MRSVRATAALGSPAAIMDLREQLRVRQRFLFVAVANGP
jgi:hypothetical protein